MFEVALFDKKLHIYLEFGTVTFSPFDHDDVFATISIQDRLP